MPTALISLVRLQSLARRYVGRGFQADSLRRQLNREGITTANLDIPNLIRSVSVEHNNGLGVQAARGNTVMRQGRNTVGRSLKVPAAFSYEVRVKYIDTDTGEVFDTVRTVYSDDELTKTQIQAIAHRAAVSGLASPRGKSDPFAPLEVIDTELLNAFHNIAGE